MKTGADRRAKNRQSKKERIYRAALEVFGKYGYRKAALDDIAEKLGITKSGLYRYCKDKRDLYEKSVSYGLIQWQQTSARSIDDVKDPLEQVKNYATAGMLYLNGNTDLKNVVQNDPSVFPLNTREDPFAAINLESMNILKKVLKRGVRTGRFRKMNVDRTASFLYSVYVMLIIRSYVMSDIELVGDMMNTALDTVLHGIVKE